MAQHALGVKHRGRGQPAPADHLILPVDIPGRAAEDADAEHARGAQSHSHRLAVEEPVTEAGSRLESVTDGVPVVELGAIASLALVSRHNRRLDGARLPNRL